MRLFKLSFTVPDDEQRDLLYEKVLRTISFSQIYCRCFIPPNEVLYTINGLSEEGIRRMSQRVLDIYGEGNVSFFIDNQ